MDQLVEKPQVPELEPLPANLDFQIYFSPHGTPKDFEGLHALIENADIYIPEGYGWDLETLNLFREVSKGTKTIDDARELGVTDMGLVELISLYNTGKLVTFIDLPGDKVERDPLLLMSARSVEDLYDNARHYLQKKGLMDRSREEYMLSVLDEKIRIELGKNSELKDKPRINVLLSLGSFHTGIYHELKRQGRNVSRTLNGEFVYGPIEEVKRRFRFGKEVSEELIAQAFLENVFYSVFNSRLSDLTEETNKILEFEGLVARCFSQDEINDIFRNLPLHGWDYFKGSFESYIQYLLEKKGIKIPESEEELSEIIKQNQVSKQTPRKQIKE